MVALIKLQDLGKPLCCFLSAMLVAEAALVHELSVWGVMCTQASQHGCMSLIINTLWLPYHLTIMNLMDQQLSRNLIGHFAQSWNQSNICWQRVEPLTS